MTKLGHHDGGGVIVTLELRADPDETRSVHRAHRSRLEALRQVLAPFDPNEWRVRTISTPETIHADLTHSRKLIEPSDLARGDHTGRRPQLAYSIGGTVQPEAALLGLAHLGAFL